MTELQQVEFNLLKIFINICMKHNIKYFLVCGSALCGGSAYAMLEEFFRSYAVSIGMNDTPQYSIMNKIAKEAYSGAERGVRVNTSFYGKRSDPDCRGSIEGIDAYNFTPSALLQMYAEYFPFKFGNASRYLRSTASRIDSSYAGSIKAMQHPLKPAPEKRPP